MSNIKQFLIKVFSLTFGYFFKEKGRRVLIYHSLYKESKDRVDHYAVSFQAFKEQIEWIQDSGLIIGRIDDENCDICLTFDDGYLDNLNIVAPYLEKKKIPWTIFVATSHLSEKLPLYMNAEELIKLSKLQYVSIGSHGVSHLPLLSYSAEEAKQELQESKKVLEATIGSSVESFSFPHGSLSRELIVQAKKAGYKIIATSIGVPNVSREGSLFPEVLNRQAIVDSDNLRVFKSKVRGYWDWVGNYFLKKMLIHEK